MTVQQVIFSIHFNILVTLLQYNKTINLKRKILLSFFYLHFNTLKYMLYMKLTF